MTDAEIEITLRRHIREVVGAKGMNGEKPVCPFAAEAAESAVIVCVDRLCAESVDGAIERLDWSGDPVLIVASRSAVGSCYVDTVALQIRQRYSWLEAFGSHPEHRLETRRDPVANVQVNTISSLQAARKLLASQGGM